MRVRQRDAPARPGPGNRRCASRPTRRRRRRYAAERADTGPIGARDRGSPHLALSHARPRTKRCRDPRPGRERTSRSAVTAPRGPLSSHRRVTHVGSGPPDPARRHPGRLGLVRPAVPRCGAPQPGGGVGPWRHGKVVRRHDPEGQLEPVPESDSRPAVAMISRRRLNRARRACAANRHRRAPGLGEESDRPEGIGVNNRTRAVHGSDMPGVRHGREEPCKVRRSLRPNPRTSPRARGERPGRPTLGAAQWRPFDERASHDVGGDISRQSSPKRFFVQVSIGPGRIYNGPKPCKSIRRLRHCKVACTH